MKSINKALDILETLSKSGELRLSEICENTGYTKSTANLILAALLKRGYVSQKKKRGKYSLNRTYLTIHAEDENTQKLREISTPHLKELSNKFKENVILCVPHNNMARILVAAETKNVLTTLVEVGAIIPLYCTSTGKILLANYSEKELEQYLKNVELNQLTPNTITDINHLRASLRMIKDEGFAYDNEEQIIGAKNVAVGIHGPDGQIIASLGITGPAVRLTLERMTGILPDIKKCALDISESLTNIDEMQT